MTILFLIALALAIPTSGLSLLVYGAVFVGKAILKAKVRMQEANKNIAFKAIDSEGPKNLPSWVKNEDRRDEFVSALLMMAQRRGVPEAYLGLMLNTRQSLEILLGFAAEMEKNGASFVEQQSGSIDFVSQMWDRLDAANKAKFANIDLTEEQYRSLHTPIERRLPINAPRRNDARATQMIEWAIETLGKEPSVIGTAYDEISYSAVVSYVHERKCTIITRVAKPYGDWLEFQTNVRGRSYQVTLGMTHEGHGSVLTSHPA
jgi:hypothetical protein